MFSVRLGSDPVESIIDLICEDCVRSCMAGVCNLSVSQPREDVIERPRPVPAFYAFVRALHRTQNRPRMILDTNRENPKLLPQ